MGAKTTANPGRRRQEICNQSAPPYLAKVAQRAAAVGLASWYW